MPVIIGRYFLSFVFVVLFQVLILNNIQISGVINPYFYVIFILLLPFEIAGWLLLTLGFLLGLSIDIFSNTLGIHCIATVFMSMLRPYVLSTMAPREGYGTGTAPRVYYQGALWFIRYALILVLAHHLVLFYIEVFKFSLFFHTFFRILVSTIFSLFLIVASQFFIFRK